MLAANQTASGGHGSEQEVAAAQLTVSATEHGTVSEEAGKAEKTDSAESTGMISVDHNGNACMLCGRPLPERTGGKVYTEFRKDCGRYSSPKGPAAQHLTTPAVQFLQTGGARDTNGFCELNFAKSCADALANRDYLYWPKSLDLSHSSMRSTAPFDARYCHLNGFLEEDVVALQHDFEGMHGKAKELCETKYAKHGIHMLTFLDMMKKARYEDKNAPSPEEAEQLAAWNCAMGDLGCDMAMCAYSFCKKKDGSQGVYGNCTGWDPVHGMPIKAA